MRKLHKSILSLVLAFLLLTTSVFAADSGAGTLLRRSYTTVGAGLDYYSSVYTLGDSLQAGYTLELASNRGIYPVLMPCDTVWGGRTMDWMVQYAQAQGYNVVAAVNTAFFNGPGVPIGIAVENGRLKVAADESNAFAVLPDGSYYAAAYPALDITLTDGSGRSFDIPCMNKLLEGEALHLYTSDYSTVSTRVEEDVWAVRLRRLEGQLTLSGEVTLEVTQVLETAQEVPIGEEYMVLCAGKAGANSELFRQFAVGDVFTLKVYCPDETLRTATQVTGCGDILVADGVITKEADWNGWITAENPRTLMGWKPDGTLVVHVADGRNPDYSTGLTLRQAAEEMLRLGCSWAVNMDGGGSSVMGVRLPGSDSVTAVNQPSDGGQRTDAAYLLLVTGTKASGVPYYWHLRENNYVVLPGQRVPLTVFATDAAMYPAAGDTSNLFYGMGDSYSHDPVVTAPDTPGSHWVGVWGSGAAGGGTLQVVTVPTELHVRYNHEPLPERMVLQRGQQLRLDIVGSHNGVPLYVDGTAVRYEQSVVMGYADDAGVFTATAPHGTKGTLTVRVGGYTHEIAVTVVDSLRDVRQNKIKTALDWYSIF